MRPRLRHLPERADQCLGCACSNADNAPAQELLFVTDSVSVRGVIAAIFIAGSAEHAEIVSLAREAIREQRAWCERYGPYNPSECHRNEPTLPIPAGEAPTFRVDES